MAAVHMVPISLCPKESFTHTGNCSKPISFLPRRRPISVYSAVNSPESSPPAPEIELEFIGPKAGEDGSYTVERAAAVSGEKLLRNIMLDNKIELYATYVAHLISLLTCQKNKIVVNLGLVLESVFVITNLQKILQQAKVMEMGGRHAIDDSDQIMASNDVFLEGLDIVAEGQSKLASI
ncbi:uncharacterized protein LOC131151903 isoform X1 [Malania oleifera]|uniref:uncharacterized protein LOC131151903 isoform X1 n=1 Tax=Malania oleifera TaxID=397392 RepID=UPI0025AE90FE|nr:uncharacterized protein LOC131151903 isoform X1 [Malania oleifera]